MSTVSSLVQPLLSFVTVKSLFPRWCCSRLRYTWHYSRHSYTSWVELIAPLLLSSRVSNFNSSRTTRHAKAKLPKYTTAGKWLSLLSVSLSLSLSHATALPRDGPFALHCVSFSSVTVPLKCLFPSYSDMWFYIFSFSSLLLKVWVRRCDRHQPWIRCCLLQWYFYFSSRKVKNHSCSHRPSILSCVSCLLPFRPLSPTTYRVINLSPPLTPSLSSQLKHLKCTHNTHFLIILCAKSLSRIVEYICCLLSCLLLLHHSGADCFHSRGSLSLSLSLRGTTKKKELLSLLFLFLQFNWRMNVIWSCTYLITSVQFTFLLCFTLIGN